VRIYLITGALIFSSLLFSSCIMDKNPPITYTDSNVVIEVKVSQEFTVSAQKEATDIHWIASYDALKLEPTGSGYIPPTTQDSNLMGLQWFKFRALSSGETHLELTMIKFIHEQPFPQPGPKIFQIKIVE